MEERIARYEAFTQKFMEMSPDELTELGLKIREPKMQKIEQEQQELREEEERIRREFEAENKPLTEEEKAEILRRFKREKR